MMPARQSRDNKAANATEIALAMTIAITSILSGIALMEYRLSKVTWGSGPRHIAWDVIPTCMKGRRQ
jgi:hypothetical protein